MMRRSGVCVGSVRAHHVNEALDARAALYLLHAQAGHRAGDCVHGIGVVHVPINVQKEGRNLQQRRGVNGGGSERGWGGGWMPTLCEARTRHGSRHGSHVH
eukprot:366034-Chlamydomonas_euryale.AAC.4